MNEREMELYLYAEGYDIEEEQGVVDSTIVCDIAADLGYTASEQEDGTLYFKKTSHERLDTEMSLEITEHPVCCVVTLLHRGERVHTTQCAPHLLAKVVEDHRKIYGEEETK